MDATKAKKKADLIIKTIEITKRDYTTNLVLATITSYSENGKTSCELSGEYFRLGSYEVKALSGLGYIVTSVTTPRSEEDIDMDRQMFMISDPEKYQTKWLISWDKPINRVVRFFIKYFNWPFVSYNTWNEGYNQFINQDLK